MALSANGTLIPAPVGNRAGTDVDDLRFATGLNAHGNDLAANCYKANVVLLAPIGRRYSSNINHGIDASVVRRSASSDFHLVGCATQTLRKPAFLAHVRWLWFI
jgi:hypothetical protein